MIRPLAARTAAGEEARDRGAASWMESGPARSGRASAGADELGRAREAPAAPTLGARLRSLRLLPREILIGRLRYRAKCFLFALPAYGWTLPRGTIAAPRALPPDPWPGNAARGQSFLEGSLRLGGQRLDNPQDLWAPRGADGIWLAEMHSFSWLRDLRALGGDSARRSARDLVAHWIERHRRWSPLAWDPLVTARRLSHWLGQYDFFAASAEVGFRQRLLLASARQAGHLARSLPAGLSGADLICAIKGLVTAGACLPGGEAWMRRGLALLARELPRQILPDGGQIERSPSRHLAVLRDLIDIKSILHAAERPQPPELQLAIDSMAPLLRLYQHGDGGLALFNGTAEEEGLRVDLVLQRADGRGRPRLTAPQTGFQRLQSGRTLVIFDGGTPAPPGYDSRAHAGTLSFEMSVGRERLVVNCGVPSSEGGPAEWHHLLRATAAHSTLVLADRNAAPLAPARLWGGRGLVRRPELVLSRREEFAGDSLVEAAHDGYRAAFGLTHRRRLFLGAGGEDLRGEDSLLREKDGPPLDFAIRFHLHPEANASLIQNGQAVLLRLPKGGGWRLRGSGAAIRLEESVYFGSGEARRSQQIVLHGRIEGREIRVKWAIQRETPKR